MSDLVSRTSAQFPHVPRFEAHFQSFEEAGDRAAGAARLAALRAALAARGVQGYVVPRADAHQNEYVPPCEERLAYLTGFTGSAGLCVVLEAEAALFVDGRYTLQAPAQVDTDAFRVVPLAETTPEAWIETHLPKGATLAFDPWRTTLDGRRKLADAVAAAGGILVALEEDPLADQWTDRPAPPAAPIRLRDLALAGEAAADKVARVQAALTQEKLDLLLISDPHAVAWLFNIRGMDVAHTPIPLAWALVGAAGRPVLFTVPGQIDPAVAAALKPVADLLPRAALEGTLAQLAAGATVRLDQATAPVQLASVVERAGGTVSKGADPIALLKAVKNEAEIAGMRAAHLIDGVALARFLHWFDTVAPGGLTEIDMVEALETFRRAAGRLTDVSFPTISGAGPNGAIVHYRVTRATNRALGADELFLLDSGAQYDEGTTDVTRTLATGTPSEAMRHHYTLVLKGHLAVGRAVFPEGTSGAQIDPFARQYLWAEGLDFDHGTGHGVGAGLSVHEGPARISKLGHVPLKAGMILSNEPGFYRTGAYGIRIETLVLVEPRHPGGDRPSLGFETLTLAPYERRLIETGLLSAAERAQIDAYHRIVRDKVGPLLDPETRAWLDAATAPLT
ncbi:aminopeptidase P family protein [Aquabacter cavernae]|uniref:aminopeptidase P family protein n=1 Tax=Aquabacter cavernae TaxID=2496029 RepID=UPI000F8E6059|nr:aminopeptidase P family protein [Aquabacter cavernae]